MTIEDKIKRVQGYEATKARWRSNYNSQEFIEASNLNKELFGIPLNRVKKCQCVEDMFFMLGRMNKGKLNQIQNQKMAQFKLHKNKLILLHGLSEQLSNANLTDEKAISLLKKHPSHIKSFETFPENWQDLCNPSAVKEQIVTKVSDKQVSIPAKEVEIETKSLPEAIVENNESPFAEIVKKDKKGSKSK